MKKAMSCLLVAWMLAAGCGGGGKTEGDGEEETEDVAGEDADAVPDPGADPDGGDPDAAEPQGETVAFAPDALSYTTVSEGTSPSIYTMSAVVP